MNNWNKTIESTPPEGVPVIGFNPEWIDEDFNPKGMRECFLSDLSGWVSARYNDSMDEYITDTGNTPTHWQFYPKKPDYKPIELGDKMIVIHNHSSHQFEIGTEVTVIETDQGDDEYVCSCGNEIWWLSSSELEHKY